MGVRLMSWLDPELSRRGTSRAAFGKKLTFDPSNFSKWAELKSVPTSIHVFTEIADALDTSLLTILSAIGILTKEEQGGIERVVESAAADFDYAVENDPNLTSDERAVYRQMRQMTRGRKVNLRVRNRK